MWHWLIQNSARRNTKGKESNENVSKQYSSETVEQSTQSVKLPDCSKRHAAARNRLVSKVLQLEPKCFAFSAFQ